MSATPITFWTSGTPRPAGSKRAFAIKRGGVPTGQVAVVDTSGVKGKTWRGDLRDAAKTAHQGRPLEGPLKLCVVFHLQRPKSHYCGGFFERGLKLNMSTYHAQRPDTTKLLRAVEDALTGILWRDDAQIAVQTAKKVWSTGTPGCQVTVGEVEE